MNKLIATFCASLCLLATLPAYAEIAVIANLNNPAAKMQVEQVAPFFLGASIQLTPIDQAKESTIRTDFYRKVTNKSQAQVRAIWSRIVFSGKGPIPKEMASDAEVKKVVASDPNAIGYIDKSAADNTVKVLLTVQ